VVEKPTGIRMFLLLKVKILPNRKIDQVTSMPDKILISILNKAVLITLQNPYTH
jgi:hypothetical protein